MRLLLTIIISFFAVGAFAQKLPESLPGQSKPATEKKVTFYPNPAINFITFEFKEAIPRGTQIQVFSFLGRQVKNIQATAQKMTVNISDLSRGIYVFQVRTPYGKIIESSKFQVAQ